MNYIHPEVMGCNPIIIINDVKKNNLNLLCYLTYTNLVTNSVLFCEESIH